MKSKVNPHIKVVLSLVSAAALDISTLHAQFVNDGATNTLANITNNLTSTLTVGTNGSFTLLVLSSNVLVVNSAHGVIGANATAQSNEVQLLSPTTRWQMGGSLFVGSNGGFSTLLVSNGATVLSGGSSTIGFGGVSGNANNNSVTVSGAGSLWSNGLELVVGEVGNANRLEVNNGGRLLSSNAIIGRSFFSTSNSVVVTGAVSVWSNRADLRLGGVGSGNVLVVSNGGWVTASNSYVGDSSAFNLALVTGSNSTWSNRADLYVGNGARGNQLMVSNGAVVVDNNGVLGGTVTSSNNLAFVTGSGSLWSNRLDLLVGRDGSNNRLVVSNGAKVFAGGNALVGLNSTAASNLLFLTGAGTRFLKGINTDLIIGSNGPLSRLVISNGAVADCRIGELGNTAASFSNEAVVTGAGSAWRTTLNTIIGRNGAGNRLTISAGALVAGFSGVLGLSPGGSNNLAIVSGSGSKWTNTLDFYVGLQGGGNRLIVSNAASAVSSNVFVGFDPSSSGNLMEVTGTNSALNNQGGVFVGNSGAANQLNASAGAQVFNYKTTVGVGVSSSNNALLVTGAGTSWITVNGLAAGESGPNNRVVISNSATLYAGDWDIGVNSSSRSNSITVTDPGSTLIVPGVMQIGSNSPFNRLVITNGAVVDRGLCHLGTSSSGSNNLVIVTGAGSVWTNMTALTVGVATGGRNQFQISNGGKVYVGDATISLNPASPIFGFQPNEMMVAGSNSLLRCTNSLSVGFAGNGSWLTVSNNATVQVGMFINVGANDSTNSLLTVDGGTLQVTNVTSTGTLNIVKGTNIFNAGLIAVDQLWMTNPLGRFVFNGGTLQTKNTTISNLQTFLVGDGSSSATLSLNGGTHNFAPTVFVASAASVVGNGTIIGPLLLNGGSMLSPGPSIGKIILINSPVLSGEIIMEIGKSGATLTNDQIEVAAPLTFGGGTLVVSNLGPDTLAVGDRFKLFNASSYAGSLGSVTLPALPPGLGWNNKLLTDGSIEVGVPVEILVATNAPLRVMAANLTSGSAQRYESPGLNIMKGLAPDIVAIQEFNVSNSFGINTPAAVSNMIATTFGTNYSYFRETNAGYSIPNGVISCYPILQSGSWVDSDTGINDRGFAWAQIDLPGTNDLYVVSVHLKASSGPANEVRRAAEAAELKDLITTNFPANAWIVMAGDFNLFSDTEPSILTFTTFLSDTPVPADQNGDPDTNAGRAQRYDRVLTSFSMTNAFMPLVMPSRTYTNGLVFDSRIYVPLAEVSPVQTNDSGALNMQHMAVVKAFNVPQSITNLVVVTPVPLTIQSSNTQVTISWPSNAFRLETAFNLAPPVSWQTISSGIVNGGGQRLFTFTNNSTLTNQFFRLAFP